MNRQPRIWEGVSLHSSVTGLVWTESHRCCRRRSQGKKETSRKQTENTNILPSQSRSVSSISLHGRTHLVKTSTETLTYKYSWRDR